MLRRDFIKGVSILPFLSAATLAGQPETIHGIRVHYVFVNHGQSPVYRLNDGDTMNCPTYCYTKHSGTWQEQLSRFCKNIKEMECATEVHVTVCEKLGLCSMLGPEIGKTVKLCGWGDYNDLRFGDSVRGQRANDLICDEYSSIDPKVYDAVVEGFAKPKPLFYRNNKWTM